MAVLAVLISGKGTLLPSMIRADLPIGLVIADRMCSGLLIAQNARIPIHVVDRAKDPGSFTARLIEVFERENVGIAAAAGLRTILSAEILDLYPGRLLNIHPSLLPAFKGPRAVRDALVAKVSYTGCTVHRMVADVDAGEILKQARVDIFPDDTEASLHARIQEKEMKIYPPVIWQEWAYFS